MHSNCCLQNRANLLPLPRYQYWHVAALADDACIWPRLCALAKYAAVYPGCVLHTLPSEPASNCYCSLSALSCWANASTPASLYHSMHCTMLILTSVRRWTKVTGEPLDSQWTPPRLPPVVLLPRLPLLLLRLLAAAMGSRYASTKCL